MPRKSLVVLQSYDAILDADAIAAHLLNRDAADVLWVEGFQHGELLGPQGYEARRRVANFLGALDTERVARDLIGLEPGAGRGRGRARRERGAKKGSPGAGARRAELDAAAVWLERTIAAGIESNAVSFNSIIHACVQTGKTTEAEHRLLKMEEHEVEPRVTSYTAVMNACARSGCCTSRKSECT